MVAVRRPSSAAACRKVIWDSCRRSYEIHAATTGQNQVESLLHDLGPWLRRWRVHARDSEISKCMRNLFSFCTARREYKRLVQYCTTYTVQQKVTNKCSNKSDQLPWTVLRYSRSWPTHVHIGMEMTNNPPRLSVWQLLRFLQGLSQPPYYQDEGGVSQPVCLQK
jgi:hypothetical protein